MHNHWRWCNFRTKLHHRHCRRRNCLKKLRHRARMAWYRSSTIFAINRGHRGRTGTRPFWHDGAASSGSCATGSGWPGCDSWLGEGGILLDLEPKWLVCSVSVLLCSVRALVCSVSGHCVLRLGPCVLGLGIVIWYFCDCDLGRVGD